MPDFAEASIVELCASASATIALKALESAKDAVWDRIAIRKAMANYAQRYIERHGQVKILGMSNPVPLFKIYTDVEIVSPDFLKAMTSVEEMEIAFSRSGKRTLNTSAPIARRRGFNAVNDIQLLNILGQPGAGKSTFLKRLGLEALLPRRTWDAGLLGSFYEILGEKPEDILWSEYKYESIPILIELRRFREESIDLMTLIENEFEVCGFPQSTEFVSHLLREGKLLVLLDGLDEVPAVRLDAAITNIRNFVDQYSSGGASFKQLTQ